MCVCLSVSLSLCVCVRVRVCVCSVPALDVAGPSGIDASGMDGNFNFTCSSGVGSSPAHSLSPCPSVTDLHQPVRNQMKELV